MSLEGILGWVNYFIYALVIGFILLLFFAVFFKFYRYVFVNLGLVKKKELEIKEEKKEEVKDE